jgi:hypothetical protein
MEKVKDIPTRHWYMLQTIINGWNCGILVLQIEAALNEETENSMLPELS